MFIVQHSLDMLCLTNIYIYVVKIIEYLQAFSTRQNVPDSKVHGANMGPT